MEIFLILVAMQTSVIWSETPAIDCGHRGTKVAACYVPAKNKIIMGFEGNQNFHLGHEGAHASGIDENKEVRAIVDKHPALRDYPTDIYDTPEKREKEKIADWFAYYLDRKHNKNPEAFERDFPDIYKVFNEVVAEILAQ